jgi:tetratricopeptide (TPR) repeat protein
MPTGFGVSSRMTGKGFCLYVLGRLHGVTRERLARAVEAAGGRLLPRPSSRADLVALGHGSADTVLGGAPGPRLPGPIRADAEIVSELSLKRSLGIARPGNPEHRHLSADEIARASGLSAELVRCLSLYDVLEPIERRFGFRDLRAAREARRLIDLGFGLGEIVSAAVVLRRSGRGLFDSSLADAPWGEILQEVAGRLGRLDGQYLLPLQEPRDSVDDIFEQAEECECAGELLEAERLYRIALRMDGFDPVIPFNLGNVLDSLSRPQEAVLAYQQALCRDPGFAEAWVNLAALRERMGDRAATEQGLRRALAARPDCREALYGLAVLMTRDARYADAWLLWESYLALDLAERERSEALRFVSLCRLGARSEADPASLARAHAPSESRH